MPFIYNERIGEVLRSPDGDTSSGSSGNVVIPVGGNTGQLQYNKNGTFGGVETTSYANGVLNLGPVANVNIEGGLAGEYLKRAPNGAMIWGNIDTVNGQPSIHWSVTTDGNNQQFVEANLVNFLSNSYVSLFRNGLLVETNDYVINDNLLTVNVQLYSGDDLDILAVPISAISGAGGGTVTSVGITAGTGISSVGGPITQSGNITITNTGVTSLTAGRNISVSSSNGAVTVQADTTAASGQLMYSNSGNFAGVPGTAWNGVDFVLGNVQDIKINGGVAGYFLQTDGEGNLAWAAGGGGGNGVPGGSNRFVQYNDNGSFGGDIDFQYDEVLNQLTVTNVAVPGNVDFSTADSVRLGNVNNLKILGGANGQYLRTDGAGNLVFAAVTGNGTVTSVGGTGSGLGFSLGGTVTSSGNLSLTVPPAVTLRTNLNIGNVANTNYNGNGDTVLNGNGQWMTVGGGGTVTRVGGEGSGLGFTLSGDVVTSGNLSLAIPSVTQLRNTLTIGNVANTNYNGSQLQYLRGDGQWAGIATPAAAGNTTEVQFNLNGSLSARPTLTFQNGRLQIGNTLNTGTLVTDVITRDASGPLGINGNGISFGPTANGRITFNNSGTSNISVEFGKLGSEPNTNVKFYSSNVQLGNVEDIHIGGGTAGYFLQTDGTGNLTWSAGGGGNGVPGGSNTTIQYNDNGVFGGSSAFTFNETSNTVTATNLVVPGTVTFSASPQVSLGSVANVKITSGSSGQVLATDGTGNLSWVTRGTGNGSVTSVTGNGSGLGFSLSGSVTTSGNLNLTIPSPTTLRTNLNIGNVGSLNLNGNSSTVLNGVGSWVQAGTGTVTSVGGTGTGLGFTLSGTVTGSGNLSLAVPSAGALRTSLNIGTVANVNLNNDEQLYLNGLGQWTSPAASTGILNNIIYGTEKVTFASETGGTVQFQILNNSIRYTTSVASVNTTLNLVADGSTAFNTLLSVGESLTATYVLTTGTNAYGVTTLQVDGVTQPVKWAGGVSTPSANSIMAYTFTVIRTGTSTYTVLGSMTRYS